MTPNEKTAQAIQAQRAALVHAAVKQYRTRPDLVRWQDGVRWWPALAPLNRYERMQVHGMVRS